MTVSFKSLNCNFTQSSINILRKTKSNTNMPKKERNKKQKIKVKEKGSQSTLPRGYDNRVFKI